MRLWASTARSGTIADGSASERTYARCSVRARKDDGVDVVAPAQQLERLREERVARAVVEGDVGGRPEYDEDAVRVDAERCRDSGVGLEVGEVVLLLQARDSARASAAAGRSGGDAPRGSPPGTTTRVAARAPNWCCASANS